MRMKELQAVVFAAGYGNRCNELVRNRVKCLLPVGPYPVIFYPLNLLQKHGFKEVLVVVHETQKTEIAQRVEKLPLDIKCEFVTISANSDSLGTADSLKILSEKIQSDALLISCDSVTDVDLFPMLKMFRSNEASLTAMFIEDNNKITSVPGLCSKFRLEKDLIAINPVNNRLLALSSSSDYEDTMSLTSHLLRSNQKAVFYTSLIDAHIYLVRKWVIEYVAESEKFSSIKGELLPYIINKQMSKPAASNVGQSEISFENHNNIFEYLDKGDLSLRLRAYQSNLKSCLTHKKNFSPESIHCFAYMAPKETFGVRVNTVPGFCYANKNIGDVWNSICPNLPLISPDAIVKSTQTADLAVGDNTTLAEKTSIKASIFGANCVVKEKTRISNCFIMNNVVINEKVTLENCIICDFAVINKNSVLKNCIVGNRVIVPENTEKEKSHLTDDAFMEIE